MKISTSLQETTIEEVFRDSPVTVTAFLVAAAVFFVIMIGMIAKAGPDYATRQARQRGRGNSGKVLLRVVCGAIGSAIVIFGSIWLFPK